MIMYSVHRQTHDKHGKVIEITRENDGVYPTPGKAYNAAVTMRRLWKEEGATKVRILVDDQVMAPSQAEHWANEEYKSLPKCHWCSQILGGDVHTHRLCSDRLFCSQACADKDYLEEVEKIKDEEEIDYL